MGIFYQLLSSTFNIFPPVAHITSHHFVLLQAASLAKRRLSSGRFKVWGCEIIVDWADPQEEPDEDTMSKVATLIFLYIVG